MKKLRIRVMWLSLFLMAVLFNSLSGSTLSFYDDFEKDLSKWDLLNIHRADIVDSGDAGHGKVLALRSGGPGVYALIKGSEDWTNYRVQGEVYFTSYYLHYMGFIYNYNETDSRVDFGSIFILGPYGDTFEKYYKKYRSLMVTPPENFTGNVLLVNPHRDSNASRLLYTETWVHLTGKHAVKPGEWRPFKAEVVGNACHFYVGDMETPLITNNFFEYSSGQVGFKPRFVGSEIRLDNIKVTGISELSYKGPNKPLVANYKPENLLTRWDAIGPFVKKKPELETGNFDAEKAYHDDGKTARWAPFETDGRGCVVVGKLVERFSGKWFSYYHTVIESETPKNVSLEFSTTDALGIYVNNVHAGNVEAQFVCWHDFWENPDHQGQKVKVNLKKGTNHIVVMVQGGRYGGDGFYAYCDMGEKVEEK